MLQRRALPFFLCQKKGKKNKPITQKAEARFEAILPDVPEEQISVYDLVDLLKERSELKRQEQEDSAITRLLRGYEALTIRTLVRDVKFCFFIMS